MTMIHARDTELDLGVEEAWTWQMGAMQTIKPSCTATENLGADIFTQQYDFEGRYFCARPPMPPAHFETMGSPVVKTRHSHDRSSYSLPKGPVRLDSMSSSTVASPTKRRRNQITPDEWAARRHEITELYRYRGWTLPRVMQEMSSRGFHASKRQYKTKITTWALDKNIKRAEATAILREHRRLTALGQSCIFICRDWPVDVANLERFSKRAKLDRHHHHHHHHHGVSPASNPLHPHEDDDTTTLTTNNCLPPSVRVIHLPTTHTHHNTHAPSSSSVPPSPTLPTHHAHLRLLFHHTSLHFTSFLTTTIHTLPPSAHRAFRTLDRPYTLLLRALSLLAAQQYTAAGEVLNAAFEALGGLVVSEHPNAVGVVLKMVARCFEKGFGEVGWMVVGFVAGLGEVRFRNEGIGGRGRVWKGLRGVFEGEDRAGQGKGGWGEGGGRAGGGYSRELVSVYELFCQDLWRERRPDQGVIVLLWYPGMFCW